MKEYNLSIWTVDWRDGTDNDGHIEIIVQIFKYTNEN